MMKRIFCLAMACLGLCTGVALAGNTEWAPRERWRGFNLLGMFIYRHSPGYFDEEDFQIMKEWGFNFARLPMDYRFWIADGDWEKIDEAKIAPIDRAVAWGRKYGIHVQLSFHRTPGYTVALPKESHDLFTDPEAQRVSCRHWAFFARRYRDVSNDEVSFNLFNEPPNDVTDAVYGAVAKQLIAAIRKEDPKRFIVADGLSYGTKPARSLFGVPNVGQATRGYQPMSISHYRASWVGNPTEEPIWPLSPDAPFGFFYGKGKAPLNVPFRLRGLPAGKLILTPGKISGKVVFRVAAEGRTLRDFTLDPVAGAAGWTNVVYRPEWKIAQGDCLTPLTVDLTEPVPEITLSLQDGDWAGITSLSIVSPDGRKAVLPFDIRWGVANTCSYRFCGWQDNNGFRKDVKENAEKELYSDKGMHYLHRCVLLPWQPAFDAGVFCMVGEFGAYKYTPHNIVLDWMEDYLRLWKERGLGWALWNLRGEIGVMDSNREDVQYENFRGHKLDRKMLDLLRKY